MLKGSGLCVKTITSYVGFYVLIVLRELVYVYFSIVNGLLYLVVYFSGNY